MAMHIIISILRGVFYPFSTLMFSSQAGIYAVDSTDYSQAALYTGRFVDPYSKKLKRKQSI